MRRLVIAAVAAATLACVPAAAAKEITSVTVCGADDCMTTRDPTLMQAMMNGGTPSDPPAHPAGAIRLRATIEEPGGETIGRFTNWWVPQTGLLAAEDGSWMELPAAAVAVLEKVTDHLVPYGPERLGAAFAGTSSHAAPPPPVRTEPVGDDGASVDWWLIVLPVGAALAAAAALVLIRRRPGGATP